MKKRTVMAVTGVLAVAMLLGGCQQSKGLETDDLKITQYKGVEVDQVEKPEEVTDEEVENSIQSTLESMAESKEITDRAVKDGDITNIDFVGKIDGKKFDGGSAEAYDLTIGSDSFIDGFEDSIIGHKVGDKFDWEGKFPDDYGNTDYAGKDVTFTITVNSITEQVVPELTDEVVKQLSENSKTVKEYKEEVKKQLEEDNESSYNDSLSSEVWEAVLNNTEIKKYPDGEKEKVEKQLREQYEQMAEAYGMEFADLIAQMGMDEDTFNEQAALAAEESVKSQMVVDAIAKKEKIELDDETYEKEVKELAEKYGYESADSLKEQVEEEDLKDIILSNMVKEWLCERCIQNASTK